MKVIKKTEIIRLWKHIPRRRKKQLFGIIFLMIINSFIEVISLGAIVPLLSSIVSYNFTLIGLNQYEFLNKIQFVNQSEAVFFYSLIFAIIALTAGLSKIFTIWVVTRYSYALGADFGINIYNRIIYQPYSNHISRNSSEVISGIQDKSAKLISAGVLPILNLFSVVPMAILIIYLLVVMDPIFAIAMFVGIGLIYTLIIKFTYKKLEINSKVISIESVSIIKIMQEGLSGIREIILSNLQQNNVNSFKKSFSKYQHSLGNIQIICNLPRQGTEALAIVFISLMLYFAYEDKGGFETLVPILGLFAYGAQKLLPIFQQIYSSLATISGDQASIRDALDMLDIPLQKEKLTVIDKTITFKSQIKFTGIDFRYDDKSPLILKNLNLSIFKGERVGIIGKSGEGKSTLLDIFMGLLRPSNGELTIDDLKISDKNDRLWWRHIAQVPQSIYFTDGTILENIAFGLDVNEIDVNKAKYAAERAQISEAINLLPCGYFTNVGERGIKLSGGQRQRLGIARALYREADVLIFDEATSALDPETEDRVITAIEGLSRDLTIIVVAHRLESLKHMDKIIEVSNGQIILKP